MSWLDRYDPEGLLKWHHFAFRVDLTRLAELRAALARWISYRDRAPLERHCHTYRPAWTRARSEANVPLDAGLLERLRGYARTFKVDPAPLELARGEVSRLVALELAVVPLRVERLARLEALHAPESLLEPLRDVIRTSLKLEASHDDGPGADVGDLDFRALFECAVEVTIGDPWALDVGLGRLGGLVAESVPLADVALVDPDWPVHIDNAEGREPCVYGFDGFELGVITGDAASLGLVELEPREQLRDFAIDRVCARLEDEGATLDEEDGDYDEVRRRAALRLAGPRVEASVAEVEAEWRQKKTALLTALDDVGEGRCALIQWTAKHPSL